MVLGIRSGEIIWNSTEKQLSSEEEKRELLVILVIYVLPQLLRE